MLVEMGAPMQTHSSSLSADCLALQDMARAEKKELAWVGQSQSFCDRCSQYDADLPDNAMIDFKQRLKTALTEVFDLALRQCQSKSDGDVLETVSKLAADAALLFEMDDAFEHWKLKFGQCLGQKSIEAKHDSCKALILKAKSTPSVDVASEVMIFDTQNAGLRLSGCDDVAVSACLALWSWNKKDPAALSAAEVISKWAQPQSGCLCISALWKAYQNMLDAQSSFSGLGDTLEARLVAYEDMGTDARPLSRVADLISAAKQGVDCHSKIDGAVKAPNTFGEVETVVGDISKTLEEIEKVLLKKSSEALVEKLNSLEKCAGGKLEGASWLQDMEEQPSWGELFETC